MGCPNTSSDAYLGCVGVPALYTEAEVSTYADRVGAQGGPGNWVRMAAVTLLRVNRIIYFKQTPGGLIGDCPRATSAGGGIGIGSAKIASVAGSAAGTIAGGATLFGGGAAAIAGTTLGTVVSAATIVGIAAIPFILLGGLFAHHAAAVQKEQSTLCDVAANYNAFADAIEAAISSGQLPLQDAINTLSQAHSKFSAELQTIESGMNAAFGYHKSLDALKLFNTEVVYPRLVPGVGGSLPSGALAVGAGVVLAKVAGVF